jgi:hypothetical protein
MSIQFLFNLVATVAQITVLGLLVYYTAVRLLHTKTRSVVQIYLLLTTGVALSLATSLQMYVQDPDDMNPSMMATDCISINLLVCAFFETHFSVMQDVAQHSTRWVIRLKWCSRSNMFQAMVNVVVIPILAFDRYVMMAAPWHTAYLTLGLTIIITGVTLGIMTHTQRKYTPITSEYRYILRIAQFQPLCVSGCLLFLLLISLTVSFTAEFIIGRLMLCTMAVYSWSATDKYVERAAMTDGPIPMDENELSENRAHPDRPHVSEISSLYSIGDPDEDPEEEPVVMDMSDKTEQPMEVIEPTDLPP